MVESVMQESGEMEKTEEVDYSRFLFRFLINKKIPYWVMVIIFVSIIFLIPRIILMQFGVGISWTNIFYYSDDVKPFGLEQSGLDYINLFGMIGITIFIIYKKAVYEQFEKLQNYIYDNAETDEGKASVQMIKQKGKTGLDYIPLFSMALMIFIYPLVDFFIFFHGKYEASMAPNKLLFYIQHYYGVAFLYAFFICMLVMTFALSYLIYELSKVDVKHYVMHEDGAAGLKIFGETAIKNILSWTVLAIIILLNFSLLAMNTTDVSQIVFYYTIIVGTLLITLIMYIVPISGAHSRLVNEKYQALEEIEDDFKMLMEMIEANVDQGAPNADPADLLPRLDFIVRSNYFSNIISLNEWPVDNRIVIKTAIAIIIPIIISVISFLIQTFLLGA